jgi:hypothetical protein
VTKPAIPSAPLAKSARVEGSGTEGAAGTAKVAENVLDPEAGVLKETLARVFVKPAAERVVMPEKFSVLPTVVSLRLSRAMVKGPRKKMALSGV